MPFFLKQCFFFTNLLNLKYSFRISFLCILFFDQSRALPSPLALTSPSSSYFHGVFVCFVTMHLALGSSTVAPVGSYFLEGGPVPVATPLRPITLLPTSPSKHWLPIAPGEAWVLMNPLLSPIHGGMLMVQSWQGKVSLSSSSWSQTRDSVYYSRVRGILCHHVQLHIIFY